MHTYAASGSFPVTLTVTDNWELLHRDNHPKCLVRLRAGHAKSAAGCSVRQLGRPT